MLIFYQGFDITIRKLLGYKEKITRVAKEGPQHDWADDEEQEKNQAKRMASTFRSSFGDLDYSVSGIIFKFRQW